MIFTVFSAFASAQDQTEDEDSPFMLNDDTVVLEDKTLDIILFPDGEKDAEIQTEFSGGISSQNESTTTTVTTTITTTTTTTTASTIATVTTIDSYSYY